MIKRLFAILTIFVLLLCIAAFPSRADFGDYAGDTDYGDDSYDYGGDYDYDDDDDDNRSYRDNFSHDYNTGNKNSVSHKVEDGEWGYYIFAMIVVGGIIAFAIYKMLR